MTAFPYDPVAALVHLHIEDLRREATAAALVRTARASRARRSWPSSVATALRETFARATPFPSTVAAARRSEPCPTC